MPTALLDRPAPTPSEIVDDLGRREFIAGGLAAAFVLGACGSDGTGASGPTTTAASGTRTVTLDRGQVEVPVDPQRVIAMENRRDLETAVVLGLPLVAVGVYGGRQDFAAPFVPFDATGVEALDTSQPNFERIAALGPDLVLSREMYLDELASGLPGGTPILPVSNEGPWRPDLERFGRWLGREAAVAEVLEGYDARLAEVRQRHADQLDSARVAIVEWYPAGAQFYAGGVDGFQLQANTLGELGGSLIPFLADRDYFDEPFSLENVGELAAADAIVLVVDSEDARAELEASPLWQSLPAVAEGRVVVTDTRTNQGSVYAATESLDLLDELYGTLG